MIRRALATVILIGLSMGQARAVSLGPECEPRGLMAKGKEALNSETFWTTQVKEIQEYVEAEKLAYRLSMIERERYRINERLEDQELQAMGIKQHSNPEIDREFYDIDKKLLQMEWKSLQYAIKWGRVCTTFAKQKLSQLQ